MAGSFLTRVLQSEAAGLTSVFDKCRKVGVVFTPKDLGKGVAND